MTSFYYYPESFRVLLSYENYGFCLLGLANLNMKEKTNWILVLVVKRRHRAAYSSGFLADKKFEFTLNLFVAEIV